MDSLDNFITPDQDNQDLLAERVSLIDQLKENVNIKMAIENCVESAFDLVNNKTTMQNISNKIDVVFRKIIAPLAESQLNIYEFAVIATNAYLKVISNQQQWLRYAFVYHFFMNLKPTTRQGTPRKSLTLTTIGGIDRISEVVFEKFVESGNAQYKAIHHGESSPPYREYLNGDGEIGESSYYGDIFIYASVYQPHSKDANIQGEFSKENLQKLAEEIKDHYFRTMTLFPEPMQPSRQGKAYSGGVMDRSDDIKNEYIKAKVKKTKARAGKLKKLSVSETSTAVAESSALSKPTSSEASGGLTISTVLMSKEVNNDNVNSKVTQQISDGLDLNAEFESVRISIRECRKSTASLPPSIATDANVQTMRAELLSKMPCHAVKTLMDRELHFSAAYEAAQKKANCYTQIGRVLTKAVAFQRVATEKAVEEIENKRIELDAAIVEGLKQAIDFQKKIEEVIIALITDQESGDSLNTLNVKPTKRCKTKSRHKKQNRSAIRSGIHGLFDHETAVSGDDLSKDEDEDGGSEVALDTDDSQTNNEDTVEATSSHECGMILNAANEFFENNEIHPDWSYNSKKDYSPKRFEEAILAQYSMNHKKQAVKLTLKTEPTTPYAVAVAMKNALLQYHEAVMIYRMADWSTIELSESFNSTIVRPLMNLKGDLEYKLGEMQRISVPQVGKLKRRPTSLREQNSPVDLSLSPPSSMPEYHKKITPVGMRLQNLTDEETRAIEAIKTQLSKKDLDDKEVLMKFDRATLKVEDFKRLTSQTNWLNDEIINAYCELLEHTAINQERTCVFFNSLFMDKLYPSPSSKTKNVEIAYENVQRWKQNLDVFKLERIFMPVNLGNEHWKLIVVDFTEQTVASYNSINESDEDANEYIDAIILWLKQESQTKRKTVLDDTLWKKVNHRNVPQQSNSYDCGAFVLLYADFLMARLPVYSFSQKNLPCYRQRILAALWRRQIVYDDEDLRFLPGTQSLTDKHQSQTSLTQALQTPQTKRRRTNEDQSVSTRRSFTDFCDFH